MIKCCKAAKGEIIGPVEAAILCWVLHSIGPVALAFDVTSDFTPPSHILLLRLLILHDVIIHSVEFDSLVLLLQIKLLSLAFSLIHKYIKLTIAGSCLRAILVTFEEVRRLLHLGIVDYSLL